MQDGALRGYTHLALEGRSALLRRDDENHISRVIPPDGNLERDAAAFCESVQGAGSASPQQSEPAGPARKLTGRRNVPGSRASVSIEESSPWGAAGLVGAARPILRPRSKHRKRSSSPLGPGPSQSADAGLTNLSAAPHSVRTTSFSRQGTQAPGFQLGHAALCNGPYRALWWRAFAFRTSIFK